MLIVSEIPRLFEQVFFGSRLLFFQGQDALRNLIGMTLKKGRLVLFLSADRFCTALSEGTMGCQGKMFRRMVPVHYLIGIVKIISG